MLILDDLFEKLNMTLINQGQKEKIVTQTKKLKQNENKIPIISVPTTNSPLTSAENKTPDVYNLVRKNKLQR